MLWIFVHFYGSVIDLVAIQIFELLEVIRQQGSEYKQYIN